MLLDDKFSLPVAINREDDEDLLPMITQAFRVTSSSVVMLHRFFLAEEKFGKRKGRRYAIVDCNDIVPGPTDKYGDAKFDYSHKPLDFHRVIPRESTMEHSKQEVIRGNITLA